MLLWPSVTSEQMYVSRAFINTDMRELRTNFPKSFHKFLPRIKRRLIENSRLFMRTLWHKETWGSHAWLDFHFLWRSSRCVFPLCAFSMQQCQHGFRSDYSSKSHLKINAKGTEMTRLSKSPKKLKSLLLSKWKLSDNGAFINMGNFCIKWAVKKTKARKCFYLPCCKCTEYIEYY